MDNRSNRIIGRWHRTMVPIYSSLIYFLCSLGRTWAEEGEPLTGTAKNSMGIEELFNAGGWPMYVLLAMSLILFAFIIYFGVIIRQGQVTPGNFLYDLRRMLEQGKLEKAREACERNKSSIAAVSLAALDHSLSVEDPQPDMLKELLEGEGNRQAVLMQNQIQYLLDIGVIAPMVGLLGTVIGMLEAFNVVALDFKEVTPQLLAGGVSKALVTTAFGLLVGIPAMAAYAFFRGKTSKLLSTLEIASVDILTKLVQRSR